jgi:hypothetical protein
MAQVQSNYAADGGAILKADVLDVVLPSGKIDKCQKWRQSIFEYDGNPHLNPLPR